MSSSDRVLNAGVLGATGTVGQRFIVLLSQNPMFRIHSLGASERSAGKAYRLATKWKMSDLIPEAIKDVLVKPCDPSQFSGCDVVFSGLDASVAGEIEKAFFEADFAVFSNAKNYRMIPNVPLCVPVVNTDHYALVASQRAERGLKKGFIVTNSNCSTSGLVVPLKALQDKFGPLRRVMVTTLQAISGAGYPGVASLDILDNIVPLIAGEEPKMEAEVMKILGGVTTDASACAPLTDLRVSATCNRVPVLDGHTECVSLEFAGAPPSIEEIKQCLREYTCEAQSLGCYSAPKQVIQLAEQEDRPQPRLDRNAGDGMSVTVGRIRECPVFHVKFTLLVHNTVLGAAGASILNAEYAAKKGYL
ncbi:aspartate semialdehyde dehydrogenase [Coemansia reversa NRRL 1564]|uniref:Aspartate-semialdehyde dehydrogenase n=1 Tax=Coemansia reversa (strain ATCC 12441 / NRRL 1564) TaxID=763665 RepID=A0A2G5BEB2_COERN|nr:aspartate semialdehyde dehydrogenase [Coemansia reversa NRRL 1564]|eukprot:PIA17358.1 aspartate semialdehyde dehydrogenase [Coemansia reversa NRRL 1564]